jgi:hypothetical protein
MAEDVTKTLVDVALATSLHPDHRATLQEWRDANTTPEEKDAALTDDERAANAVKKEQEAKEKTRPSGR